MKLYIIILLTVLMLAFVPGNVLAADFTAPYLQNYSFITAVSVNGNPIDPGSGTCNFTIRNIYGVYLELETNMSLNAAGDASILLNSSALNIIGYYSGKVACQQDGLNETRTFILEVVPSREKTGYGFFLILSIAGGLILILAIFQGNFYLGFLSGLLILSSGMWGMIYGIGPIANLYSRILSISLLGIGITINIAAGLEAISELRVRFS